MKTRCNFCYRKLSFEGKRDSVDVTNFTSGEVNPITWKEAMDQISSFANSKKPLM